MVGNVIVGQSGGPTAVINSSLVGVYKTAKDRGASKVYGMVHGIQGLLEGRYVDLDEHIRSDLDIELLKLWQTGEINALQILEICNAESIQLGHAI